MKIDFKKTMYERDLNDCKYKTSTMLEELYFESKTKNNLNVGWLNYPREVSDEELNDIKKTAEKIKKNSDVFIVIGIGGSYLGARAVIEALTHKYIKKDVEILFAGTDLSSTDMYELLEYLQNKRFSINVISKSGSTMEPLVAFRFLKKLLYDKYGEGAKERIYITTGDKGPLRELVDKKGYKSLLVPNNVGGRYSVLTPVGLLPMAVAGLNIDELIRGANEAIEKYMSIDFDNNDAMKYAAMRNVLSSKGKVIEIFSTFEPKLHYLSEWWKQLFGESECKRGKGIFPVNMTFTTDLHSLGQAIQEGPQNIFESVLKIKKPKHDLKILKENMNFDGLNYMADKTVNYINEQTRKGTVDAHFVGNVPVIQLEIEKIDERNLAYLMYFYMITCVISCYVLGVDPFNQPGVEKYKENMLNLLK